MLFNTGDYVRTQLHRKTLQLLSLRKEAAANSKMVKRFILEVDKNLISRTLQKRVVKGRYLREFQCCLET